jgi:hypothetical protein
MPSAPQPNPIERPVPRGFRARPFAELVQLIAASDPGLFFLVALPKPTSYYCEDCF